MEQLGEVTLFAPVPGSPVYEIIADQSQPGNFILLLKAGLNRIFANGSSQRLKDWVGAPIYP